MSTKDFSVHKFGNIGQNNPANCQYTRGPVKVLKSIFLKILQILKIRTKLRTGTEIRTGTDYPDQKSGHGPDHLISGPKIRTTDRTNEYPDQKSGPRTEPKKSGPHYPDHGPDRKNPDRTIRTTDRNKKIRTKKYPDYGPDRTITDRGPGNYIFDFSESVGFVC